MSYKGATIEPRRYLDAVKTQAQQCGFSIQSLGEKEKFPIYWLERPAATLGAPAVFISTGVHGDEPAGPLAVLELMRKENPALSRSVKWCISPMLNPTGFARNIRENKDGVDLNRDFLNTRSKEVEFLMNKLESTHPFDLALLLHEDWESSGFYLYDLDSNPDPALAKSIVEEVAACTVVDTNETIDGMNAASGIISVNMDQAESDPKLEGQWPEAFYLVHKSLAARQYTLEAASSLDMDTRVKSLSTAVKAAISHLRI